MRDLESERRHLNKVRQPDFIDELHHLTCTPPFVTGDIRDEGWSCRTQALLTSLVISAFRIPAGVSGGKAFFGIGPTKRSDPVGSEVNPHAWTVAESHGLIDLSPRFEKNPQSPRLSQMQLTAVFRNVMIPSGKVHIVQSETEYQDLLSKSTFLEGLETAIYFPQYVETVDSLTIGRASEIGSSPILDEIIARYGSNVVAHAARHLYDFAYDKATSLRRVSQADAWLRLSRSKRDTAEWLSSRIAR